MSEKSFADVLKELSKPFSAKVIQWRAGATTKDKSKAQALAYVDLRPYFERLDEAVGNGNWWADVEPIGNGALKVMLSIKVGGETYTKTDVGEADPQDSNTYTSAFAQGFKRACAQFGLGRYLYRLPKPWVAYDAQRRRLAETPQLPAWAMPEDERKEAQFQKAAQREAELRGYSKPDTPPTNDNGKNDPANVIIKFGKHRGKTLGEILAVDKGYLEWLAEKSTNDFIASRARQLLEAQPVPEQPAEAEVTDLPVAAAPEPAVNGNGNGNGAGAPPPPPNHIPDFDDDIPF